eukprot:5581399-Prymnesium_polylepis.1
MVGGLPRTAVFGIARAEARVSESQSEVCAAVSFVTCLVGTVYGVRYSGGSAQTPRARASNIGLEGAPHRAG